MRARRSHLSMALAVLAAALATLLVVQSRAAPLPLMLLASTLVSILALEVGLRAAPLVAGVVLLLFGGLLWSDGGYAALLCGLLLLGSAAAQRGVARERDGAQPG